MTTHITIKYNDLADIFSKEKNPVTILKKKKKKVTYTYNSLQFPAEMNDNGGKTPRTFIFNFFTHDYRGVFKWVFTQLNMDSLMADASILENEVADGRFKAN